MVQPMDYIRSDEPREPDEGPVLEPPGLSLMSVAAGPQMNRLRLWQRLLRLMEHDAGRYRYIQAAGLAGHRNGKQLVALITGVCPQTFAFSAHNNN